MGHQNRHFRQRQAEFHLQSRFPLQARQLNRLLMGRQNQHYHCLIHHLSERLLIRALHRHHPIQCQLQARPASHL